MQRNNNKEIVEMIQNNKNEETSCKCEKRSKKVVCHSRVSLVYLINLSLPNLYFYAIILMIMFIN